MRSTYISTAVLALVAIACVGAILIGSQQHTDTSHTTTTSQHKAQLTTAELDARLASERATIQSVLTTAFPALSQSYTIGREQLFDDGSWYGAILTYKGTDENNRDSLRVLLQKKDNDWVVRTSTPLIVISKYDVPDAPAWILDAINKPAYLPGTPTSPSITPAQ